MKAVEPQSGRQSNGDLTLERRAETERNLVLLLGIAKRSGVPAALEEFDRLIAEKRARDQNLQADASQAINPDSSMPTPSSAQSGTVDPRDSAIILSE